MSLKLPSILDSDLSSVYAADEETYLFQNVNDLPDDVLINQCLPLPENLSARSIKIPGTAKPGFSEIYRNAALPNGLKESLTPELNTYPKFSPPLPKDKLTVPVWRIMSTITKTINTRRDMPTSLTNRLMSARPILPMG